MAIVVYKNMTQAAYAIFNNTKGFNIDSWMDRDYLQESSWTDIQASRDTNFFSVRGDREKSRSFFMNLRYGAGGCSLDKGWLVVIEEKGTGNCDWDKDYDSDEYPVIKYSSASTVAKWNSGKNVETTDSLAVYIKYLM